MKVFISHIHEEAVLAKVLKDWIESTFVGQIQVFVSSDIKDIPAGSKWLAEIDSALNSSTLFILLCSQVSISRPWINFEAGCAWIKNVPLIPLCHSGYKKSELPSPLSIFQTIEIESVKFVEEFFESLKFHFHIPKLPRLDKNAMREELGEAINSINYFVPSLIKPKNKKIKTISEDDALNLIESWMGSRSSSDNTKSIRFVDVDNKLDLPEGTTKRLIERAARRYDYVVRRKGDDTIIFEDAQNQNMNRGYDPNW
jgi:hypothetical protein